MLAAPLAELWFLFLRLMSLVSTSASNPPNLPRPNRPTTGLGPAPPFGWDDGFAAFLGSSRSCRLPPPYLPFDDDDADGGGM